MFVPWFTKPDTEKKVLQAVNLAPSKDLVEKIVDVHPMKQIAIMSVVQVCVFGFMLLCFKIIGVLFK